MFFNASPEIFLRAKELRDHMTPAEKYLWNHIRSNKLQGFRFKAQHPFSRFIIDFYCHKARLGIEIDGEVHDQDEQMEKDAGREAFLKENGIHVIRFSNQEVLQSIDEVLKKIQQNLKNYPAKQE